MEKFTLLIFLFPALDTYTLVTLTFFIYGGSNKWMFFSKKWQEKNNKNGKKIFKAIKRRVWWFYLGRFLGEAAVAKERDKQENQ